MKQVHFQPFSAGRTEQPLSADGTTIGSIHVIPQRWQCRDGLLSFSILSQEELSGIPAVEASEPMASALARIGQFVRAYQAHLIIERVSEFDQDFYQHLAGCRFVRLQTAADLVIWDALLSLGLPIFGLCDQIVCQSLSANAKSAFQSLLFGSFYGHADLMLEIDEGPHHCAIQVLSEQASTVRVIVRGGYELTQLAGPAIDWKDSGREGYVRFEIAAGTAWAWTQPRFVAMPAAESSV